MERQQHWQCNAICLMHNNTVSKKHKQLSVLWNLQVRENAIHCRRMKCFCCCKQVQAHNLYWVYEVSEHLSVKREASRSLKDFTFLKLWICVKKKTNINPAGTWVIKWSQSLKRFCFQAHFQKQHLHTTPFKTSIGFWIDFFFCFVFFHMVESERILCQSAVLAAALPCSLA